ncbi:MAG: MaoC family dehydratase [Myxococcota bacterium]|nr:MaoC family dehydratase [Myxococcota bacterium]
MSEGRADGPTERLVVPDLASLKQLVGSEIGVSEWITVDQRRIDLFAEATGDHQWIHTDPERCKKESPFGSTIAHGHLTLSLAPHLLTSILEIQYASMVVNPGIEKMRLRAPVRSGDRVRLRASLKALRELPGGAARGTIHMIIEIEGESKPAAVGDALLVYFP